MREEQIRKHLVNDLIPFWKKLRDNSCGGFYGEMDYSLNIDQRADKGCILNSRILWFFANAFMTIHDNTCLEDARHAYEFLKNAFYDKDNGGVFWSVTYDGKPKDDMKHTYNQAFAIYALASYYRASGDQEALALAYDLADKVETVCRDDVGYLEAFNRQFKPELNEKLSENGVMAGRTMNTLLHVFEAYTELYLADGNSRIAARMEWMLDIFADKIYNSDERRLEVFFDKDWNTLIDLNSYGHDIEASWLIDRGVDILGNPKYTEKILPITRELAAHIYSTAFDQNSGSLFNECEKGKVDRRRIWWVQAEGVLGFLNSYRKDPAKKEYLPAAGRVWDFIREHIIDPRKGSEWFNELDANCDPIKSKEIAGPWKCPYHNGRMCFEIINKKIIF